MKAFIAFAFLVLTVNADSDAELWAQFKKNHSKTYKNLVEEKLRFTIFQSNLRDLEEHNAKYEKGEETYYMAINKFSDITLEEFRSIYLKYRKPDIQHSETFELPEVSAVPVSIDWRTKGAVLEVKDQGDCGSCWAFSTTGALEAHNAIKHGVKLSLSEEDLIQCSKGNAGCDGGDMMLSFTWVKNNGIATEASYPYTSGNGVTGKCKKGKDSGIKVTGYVHVASTEDALKNALGTVGPLAIGINGDGIARYGGGILNNPKCNKTIDHGVVAVGYGTQNGLDYFIVKNSWGTNWGEKGYIRMARNKNFQCAIGMENSYPTLA